MLDVRQMRVALRRLRQLTRTGHATELDLDETIDETCKNAGEIEVVFRAAAAQHVRLLLLMDVGGTMDPYSEPVSRLLTALHEERGLREFQPYYFHNCVYDHVYTQRAHAARRRGADRRRAAQARQRMEGRDRRRRRDAPRRAARSVRQHRPAPHLADRRASPGCTASPSHFDASVWLNPEGPPTGKPTPAASCAALFPMFHLSVDGLTQAMQRSSARASRRHEPPIRWRAVTCA